MTTAKRAFERPNGSAAAALVAGGLGSFAVGLMTVLAEASDGLASLLALYKPAGPLSGKTTVAVAIWLVAWAVLGRLWGDKDVDFDKAATWAFVLLGAGLVATFPPFFGLFAAE
ncbi:MAG: hypothetical protein ACRDG5_10350 [Anaerolineales bacterium]